MIARARNAVSNLNPRSLSAAGILLVLCIIFFYTAPNFGTLSNWTNIGQQVAPVVLVGAAVTIVMVAGGLDLSVGGVLALSGVVAAYLTVKGVPIPLAFILGTLVGTLVGVINGFLIVIVGLNTVIATLGTLYVSRGLANIITSGNPINFLPDGFDYLGNGLWLGIPIIAIIALVVAVIFAWVQRKTLLGKYSVAIGSNFEAAQLSAIRVDAVRVVLYGLAGSAAGFAGVLVASQLNSGQPTVGVGFEFAVIVAAVLGGTTLSGGRGLVLGTVIGALIVGVLNNAMNLLNIQQFWQQVMQGLILVLVVTLDTKLQGAKRPAWLPRRKPPAASPAGPSIDPRNRKDERVAR